MILSQIEIKKMALRLFNDKALLKVSEALDIAEDITGNYYKFSSRQWGKYSFDVKTLSSLKTDEISDYAFAVLSKIPRVVDKSEQKTKKRDFYFICLQDHHILKALARDKDLGLLPLLIYIFTHEMVHIIRFCNFLQRFDVSEREKNAEERIVHAITFDILQDVPLIKLDYVLDSYRDFRICELSV